jgi:hypothetical protein
MLSRPDPREGLTPASPIPHTKIIYDRGETAETLAAKDAKELRALTNAKRNPRTKDWAKVKSRP